MGMAECGDVVSGNIKQPFWEMHWQFLKTPNRISMWSESSTPMHLLRGKHVHTKLAHEWLFLRAKRKSHHNTHKLMNK